ncbi:MAG: class I SAM-dependent methyltransferase [Crocinitomicaceae bacterium]
MLKGYLKYRKQARNAHGIHSPYVFDFFRNALVKSRKWEDRKIHELRRSLKKDQTKLAITDLGAGSKKDKAKERSVSSIAKHAAVSRKYGRLLAKMVDHYQLEYIVELGTSLGLGTAYLSQSNSVKKVVTIEGSAAVQEKAKSNLRDLGVDTVHFICDEFSEGIKQAVKEVPRIDLVYIDGNHTYSSTLEYFRFFLAHAHNDTFLVFDDIHWSLGMQKAWQEIVHAEEINVSMELYRMGIVIKRKEQQKEHFILKF